MVGKEKLGRIIVCLCGPVASIVSGGFIGPTPCCICRVNMLIGSRAAIGRD